MVFICSVEQKEGDAIDHGDSSILLQLASHNQHASMTVISVSYPVFWNRCGASALIIVSRPGWLGSHVDAVGVP